MSDNMRVLVTGSSGFIGKAVTNNLLNRGLKVGVVFHSLYDLRKWEDVKKAFNEYEPTHVIHLAANLGGIGVHLTDSADIVHDNTIMGLNMLKAAHQAKVKKFVNIGTSCSYPADAPIPLSEDQLWDGFPTEVTAPYGVSKLLLMLQGQVLHKQHGFRAITVIPANVYGPGDTFDTKKSHVIPALIKEYIRAEKGEGYPVVWGTGNATREFIYVDDCAEAIVRAMLTYESPEPLNIGSGNETLIRTLAFAIGQATGYPMSPIWDNTKPDGAKGRVFNISRSLFHLGEYRTVTLKEGLMRTVKAYKIQMAQAEFYESQRGQI